MLDRIPRLCQLLDDIITLKIILRILMDFYIMEYIRNSLITKAQIRTRKHKHGLVLLYSNKNWRCKICLNPYTNNDSTYYCSLCNFNICNYCIGYEKKFPLKKCHHEQTKFISISMSYASDDLL
jgi:hypothetical protein